MDEEKSESMMSDLDDMWYTGDKESNIQDFEDEDLVDNEDFKEEMNAYIVQGSHVPYDKLNKLQDSDEETTPLVEIDLISTLQDEPKITLVEKSLRPKYMLKYQDIIGIGDDKFKYSCSTNIIHDSLNSMPCDNNDYVDRLDFLENDDEAMLMFEPFNFMPKEPLPN
jgi:hypothetical protein